LNPLIKNQRGDIMTTQTIRNTGHHAFTRAEAVQDLLLVSSFGLWAMLIGLAPVLAWHLVMAA
jgi:hypothetical protein